MRLQLIRPFHLTVTRILGALASTRILGALVVVILALAPGVAVACVIDNTASLSVDGVRAQLTTQTPTDVRQWAPFTVTKSFAAGTPVQVSESRAELLRSLAPATVDAPYHWSFGDGGTAVGHVVSHRYAHAGTYQIVVAGFNQGERRWFTFDKVMLHIVPPGQVVRANLSYYGLRGLDIIMGAFGWIVDAALILLVLAVVVHRWRRRGAKGEGRRAEGEGRYI